MQRISEAYIDGAFVPVHGREEIAIVNPATEAVIGHAVLADRADAQRAIEAAHRAQVTMRNASKEARIAMLRRLESAVLARTDDIREATIAEYGGPSSRSQWVSRYAAQCFAHAADALEAYAFTRRVGESDVTMEPVGVSALLTPWNSAAGSICNKLASALAAGCACVVKPSELGPIQARVIAEAIHEARLPRGAVNLLVGRGQDAGDELGVHPNVAKISFTGSTATGTAILRAAAATVKRVALSLTGKSASVILEDADFARAIPAALGAGIPNNGQACIAGTRILVPEARLDEALRRMRDGVARLRVGDPREPSIDVGPLANRNQYERVQHYIALGLDGGARIVAGGPGRPAGSGAGYFVRPTVFADVDNTMTIAREEIFGPVLCVIAYRDEDEAVRIANDSDYGLAAYVFSSDTARARDVARRLEAGSVLINTATPDLLAPFGGVKQSGFGREFGVFGLEAYLEPKTITG